MLGCCPGLNALSYCVLEYGHPSGPRSLDHDVLYSRPMSPEAALDYSKRCRVHHLVLSVVLERHPPALIALGPPTDGTEPAAAVEAMRGTLTGIASVLRVQILESPDQEALVDTLGLHGKSFGRAIHRAMGRPLGSRDRRIVYAAAAAMAASARAP